MAGKGPKPLQIAVCGLTSSMYMHSSHQGQGAGKSLLCNRFVRPNFDDLFHNHPSVLNHSDYGGTVVNNTHFLYWGEKSVGMDNGEEAKIQIIEHTEFIDDATLKPFSYPKHYYKRCAQLKIQSGGKVAYVHPDQLSLPENYKASGFPDKFLVDGFLVCVDVSCESTEMEVEFVENLLTSLAALKKPLVVAFTKFDQAKPNTVQAMQELLAKMKRQAPPTVEVSALKGINVDLSFLLLAHLIDSKKSSSRLVNYAVAKQNLDDRISSCERSFQDLLDRELNDFTLPLEPALTRFSGSPEYKLVVELCGNQRSRKLVQAKLNYGKKKQVQKLTEEFFGRLPRILMELLPELDLDATPEQCKERLKQSSAFGNYFCEEKNWEENIPFLARATPLIPFSLVSDNSTNSRSTEIIKTYIDKILLVKRQKLAYDRLKVALATASQLKPGTEMESVFKGLGLEHDAKLQPRETLAQLYREKMSEVEVECARDFEELLLEHVDLFIAGDDNVSDIMNEKLKDFPAYQRLEYRANDRQSIILKFISHLQFVDKGPYCKSHLIPYLEEARLDKGDLYTSRLWFYDSTDTYLNIAIMARLEQSALYMQNDIKTHCTGAGGLLMLDGHTYRPEIKTFHGDVTTLNSEEFVPQCAILIATSAQCVEWLEGIASSLFSPGDNTDPPYRGMPVVILALDYNFGEGSPSLPHKDSPPENDFHKKVKGVANSLQCVLVADKPTPFLSQRLVVASQVEPLLRALVNSVVLCQEILAQPPPTISPKGFNIAVCSISDNSSPDHQLSPLVNHQMVCYNTALFVRTAIEKQHRACAFTFHSAFNVADIKSTPRIGYILVYSTTRRATLSALKWLKPQLYPIPTLVLAMTTDGPKDTQLLEEGQEYAEKNSCMFMTSEHWKVGCTASFFIQCWFSRLSTWKVQCPSDELKRKDRGALPLPESRPLPELPSVANSLSSIPVAIGPVPEFTKHSPPLPLRDSYSEEEVTSPTTPNLLSPTHNLSTLPRSPSRTLFIPPTDNPGDSIYSNPQELGAKDSTLQRKRHSQVPIQVIETEPSAESEYSTVVDHMKSKQKLPPVGSRHSSEPPGGSRHPSESTELSEEDQRSLGVSDHAPLLGKSPAMAKKPLSKPLSSPDPRRSKPPADKSTPSPEDEYATVQSPQRSEALRRSESPGSTSDERVPLIGKVLSKIKTPLQSPASSPSPSRRTPQRDSGTPQGAAESEGGMYAEVNPTKRKVSLPDVLGPSPAQKPASTAKDAALLGYDRAKEGVGSRPEAKGKAAPPPIKPKPKPGETGDLYAVVQPKPKKPPPPAHTGSGADDQPLLPSRGLERDDVEEEVGGTGGGTYAQVQKKPKGVGDQLASPNRGVASLVRDVEEEEERGGANTYSVVQKKPKKTREPNAEEEQPLILSKPPARGKLERDTEVAEQEVGGDSLYAAVKPKAKKAVPTPPGGAAPAPTPPGGAAPAPTSPGDPPQKVLKKMYSVPRYDHLPVYDHLPNEGEEERDRGKSLGSEPTSPSQPVPESEPLYAVATPKTKPPPPVTKPKPHLLEGGSLSPKNDEVALLTEDPGECDDDDDEQEAPTVPSRNYDAEDVEGDVPPPLPPRRYSYSDIEDNDEDVISDNEQDIQTISTAEQMALYASVCQYQKSLSNKSTVSSSSHDEFSSMYDTLENVAAQTKGGGAKGGAKGGAQTGSSSAAAALGIPPETVFTPQQLKVIKQQQKLLVQLQKKIEKEQERRRKQEAKKRQKEEEEKEKKKGKGGKKGKGKKGKQERVRYFSSPLEQVAEDDGVPLFVKRCAAYVEKNGLNVEGIYRVSGKKEDVLSLQDKFDEDNNMVIEERQYCEAAVSSALKAFFKLLPLPLIVDTVAVKMLSIISQSGMELSEQQLKTQEVLRNLPRCNLNTLHFLINHLHLVQKHAEKNKMNASNLAIVFWPTLMRPPILDLADPSKQMGWQLAMMRIIEHPEFVPLS